MPRTPIVAAVSALLPLLLLAGCAGAGAGAGTGPDPVSTPSASGYLCSRVPISEEAYATRLPLEEAAAATRTAFAEATDDTDAPLGLTPEEGWFVVGESDELRALLREAPGVPDPALPDVEAGHEVVEILRSLDPSGPDWRLAQRSVCALQRDLGALDVPEVALAAPTDPTSDEVDLLVSEMTCSSGRDATGRIEVVRLEEDADRVVVVLGVRPLGGAHSCQGTAPTPYALALAAPLGDRALLDGGFAAPRPITVAVAVTG